MKKLVLVLIIAFAGKVVAQENYTSVGFLNTVLDENAVRLAIDYSKKLEPKLELFKASDNGLVSFSPNLKVLTGGQDAFSGILIGYTGNFMRFKTTEVAGVTTPDLSKSFHNFPVTVGIETSDQVARINTLVEGGYVPMFRAKPTATDFTKKFVQSVKLGAFLQGGYKFSLSDDALTAIGGKVDESQEMPDEFLGRLKFRAKLAPKWVGEKGFGFSLRADGSLWLDMVNGATYYRIEGAGRIILTPKYFFDFSYEKGSGAPNFNEGEQWSANIGITF